MKEDTKKFPVIGVHFGKTDLDRYGYFAEMSYLHGAGYTYPVTITQVRDAKGRQMLPEFPKTKVTGLEDCYFDKVFKRLFTGEAYSNPFRRELLERNENNKKNRTLFRLVSYTHVQSTPDDFFGCFTKSMKAFDPRSRPKDKEKEDKSKLKKFIQFMPQNPPKKGGYGYLDITINPYPKYVPTPYEIQIERKKKDPKEKTLIWLPISPPGLFQSNYSTDRATYNQKVEALWSLFGLFRPTNPAKSLGGCMDGCFTKWPSHSVEPYIEPWKIQQGKSKKDAKMKDNKNERPLTWIPNGSGKTNPTPSVLQRKVYLATNNNTWRQMRPITYTREFI